MNQIWPIPVFVNNRTQLGTFVYILSMTGSALKTELSSLIVPCALPNLQYLLSTTLQKQFADPWPNSFSAIQNGNNPDIYISFKIQNSLRNHTDISNFNIGSQNSYLNSSIILQSFLNIKNPGSQKTRMMEFHFA